MDNYKLDIENIAHNCEFCGYENTDWLARIYLDNKFIWKSSYLWKSTYYYPEDEEVEEFRQEVAAKLKELGIERDLSDSCPYYWSDD